MKVSHTSAVNINAETDEGIREMNKVLTSTIVIALARARMPCG